MMKKIMCRLVLLIGLFIFLYSCRNENFATAENNPQHNNVNFFKHSRQNGALAKSNTDYITILEDYNRETDFLSAMPDQKGMPIWDKMYAVETDNAVGVMIPLSYDNETMSSILFATLDGKNTVTGVKDYDNALLEDIVYDQKISKENREGLFLTFMHMDNRTFGNEQFIGIPKDLFVGKKSDDEYGVLWVRDLAASSSVTTQGAGKLMMIETCYLALHCTHHGIGLCDAEQGCTACGTTFCTYEVIGTADDPFPSTGGGSTGGGCFSCGGGGGGNGPGPNVPSNPCSVGNASSAFYRPMPGCGGGGTLPEIDDPCKKTKKMLNSQKIKTITDDLKNHMASGTGEKGWRDNKVGNPTQTTQNSGHSVNFGDPSTMNGGYHNHTGTKVDIFSATDIDVLLEVVRYQSIGNAGNAYMGLIAPNGIHYVIYFSGNHNDLPQNAYTSEEKENWELEQILQTFALIKKPEFKEIINGKAVLNSKGLEQIFFNTLQKMGLYNKIILQKIENSQVLTISLNADGSTFKIPCN